MMEAMAAVQAGQVGATVAVRAAAMAEKAVRVRPWEGAAGERRAEAGKPRRMKVSLSGAACRAGVGERVAVKRAGGRAVVEEERVGVRVGVRVMEPEAEREEEGEGSAAIGWQVEAPAGRKKPDGHCTLTSAVTPLLVTEESLLNSSVKVLNEDVSLPGRASPHADSSKVSLKTLVPSYTAKES